MEIGALFKGMRASRCRPGSPAGPSAAPAEPRPSETRATFPGAAAAAQSTAGASSLALTAWRSWQLASLNFKPAFRPGVPPRGETARSSACQQLIRATLTPATRLHPRAIQTAYPHTANHAANHPNSIQTSKQPLRTNWWPRHRSVPQASRTVSKPGAEQF